MKKLLVKCFYYRKHIVIACLLCLAICFHATHVFKITHVAQAYEQLLNQAFQTHHENLKKVAALQQVSFASVKQVIDCKYGSFIYSKQNQSPIYWSTNEFKLPLNNFKAINGIEINQTGCYVIQVDSFIVGNESYYLATSVPLVLNYDYLHSTIKNKNIIPFYGSVNTSFSVEKNGSAIHLPNTKQLLFAQINQANQSIYIQIAVGMYLTLLLYMVWLIAQKYLVHRRNASASYKLIYLAILVLLIRTLLLKYETDLGLRSLSIFNPNIFSADILNNSLGQLIFNLLSLSVLFSIFKLYLERRKPNLLSGFIYAIVVIAITLYHAYLVEALVWDSTLSLHLSILQQISLELIIYLSILVIISFNLVLVYQSLFLFIAKLKKQSLSYYVLFSIALFVSFLCVKNHVSLWWQVPLIFAIFCAISLPYFRKNLKLIQLKKRSYLLVILFLFITISAQNYLYNKKQLAYASNFLDRKISQFNLSGNTLFKMLLTINNTSNFWKHASDFYSKSKNHAIKDTIIGNLFSTYASSYEIQIYAFDASNKQLFNTDTLSYDFLNNIYSNHSDTTEINGLKKFKDRAYNSAFISKYITPKYDSVKLIIIAKNKRGYQDNILPNLVRQKNTHLLNSNDKYAIYVTNLFEEGDVAIDTSDYSLTKKLSSNKIDILEKGNKLLVRYSDNNKLSGFYYFEKANYTNLFILVFIAVLIYLFFNYVVSCFGLNYTLNWKRYASIFSQIQISIFLISTIIISIIVFTVIKLMVDKNDQDSKSNLHVQIDEVVHLIKNQYQFYVTTNTDSLITSQDFNQYINSLSQSFKTNIIVYNKHGKLIYTTMPYLLHYDTTNQYIHPQIFQSNTLLQNQNLVSNHKISNIKYKSVYGCLRNANDEIIAYIEMPHLDAAEQLQFQISNFLSRVIGLAIFIILLSVLLSYFVAKRIITPVQSISAGLQQLGTTLTASKINYRRNDELYSIVKAYNKLADELNKSIAQLAKTERELAWKEMAKQVAHEIKNPLTPIKLSIQYIEQMIKSNHPSLQQLAPKIIAALVLQIESLSNIASDFSLFANIERGNPELVDIHFVLNQVIELYQQAADIEKSYHTVDLQVFADKVQLNRLFTNLIKNAIEAQSIESSRPKIEISTRLIQKRKLQILITDYGSGIAEEHFGKLFQPNFTTKNSGTGLGLAICKKIVEQAGGSIEFESKLGVGSTFIIHLPVSKVND